MVPRPSFPADLFARPLPRELAWHFLLFKKHRWRSTKLMANFQATNSQVTLQVVFSYDLFLYCNLTLDLGCAAGGGTSKGCNVRTCQRPKPQTRPRKTRRIPRHCSILRLLPLLLLCTVCLFSTSVHLCLANMDSWSRDFEMTCCAELNGDKLNTSLSMSKYDRIWWNKVKLTELNNIFPSMHLKTKQGAKSWVHPACACFKQKRLLQYRHLEILNSIPAESTPLTKSKTCPKHTFGPVDKRILLNAQDSINYWYGRYGRELSCRRIHQSVDLLLDMAVLWGPWVPSKAYPLTSRLLAASEIASSFLHGRAPIISYDMWYHITSYDLYVMWREW